MSIMVLVPISVSNLKDFYEFERINAVQVVHKEFLNPDLNTVGNSDLKLLLNEYYNNPRTAIDDSTVKEWYTPVKLAMESHLAILTFSDNPHEPKNAKHGLAGIGSHYTWIKMDEMPSLEGLRQAFLLPQFRIKCEFDCPGVPYTEPELWIKSITVHETAITEVGTPLVIEFSPQLNTIIGGRGSGKSSILRFIRGVFNRLDDLNALPDILADHNNFYKAEGSRPKIGVMLANSVIQIIFIRRGISYRITVSNIQHSGNQTRKTETYNDETCTWEEISDEGYLEFFAFEQYSQKQIYEIAQEPNALRERIDFSIAGIEVLKSLREQIRNQFLEISAAIRTSKQVVSGKGRLLTKIRDLEVSLDKLQKSGIAELLKKRNTFISQEGFINDYLESLKARINDFDELISRLNSPPIDIEQFNEGYRSELTDIFTSTGATIDSIKGQILLQKDAFSALISSTEELLNNSQWRKDYDANLSEFETKKQELQSEGINDIGQFERYLAEKNKAESELKEIIERESVLTGEVAERNRLQGEYLNKCKEITRKRSEFIAGILEGGKVKINIKPLRNKADYHNQLREVLQRESGFETAVDTVVQSMFNGNVETRLPIIRKLFLDIRSEAEIDVPGIDGHFKNLILRLTDSQMDELDLIVPEDEIEVQYKPTSSSTFKSLSTASAGQKTTAILTYLLSHGVIPLILDQPEDDLDNRLVYELVVDRLRRAKESRQIIVVTHNANIPVNGDSELIISMSSESKTLKVLCSGTVEQPQIKKEICDVMEGTEQAFEMRSRRYKSIANP